jgi:hypothetical protein
MALIAYRIDVTASDGLRLMQLQALSWSQEESFCHDSAVYHILTQVPVLPPEYGCVPL